jgi:hypothetical protein
MSALDAMTSLRRGLIHTGRGQGCVLLVL